jgi:AraC family transcriptional regulator
MKSSSSINESPTMVTKFARSVLVNNSPEFDSLLRGPSWRGISSRQLDWTGFVVEEYHCEPGERPEATSDRYILALWTTYGTGLHKHGRDYTRFTKSPGSITFVPVGTVPAVISDTSTGHICCSLDSSWVNAVEDELDRRPPKRMTYWTGFHDSAIEHLMSLLAAETKHGGPMGRLYADHIAHALTLRLLFLGVTGKQNVSSKVSPLPRPALRRVLERMQDISSSLDLHTLAAESGYSRRHFLRMFQRATGYTPHHYLLQLRLERARELMKQKSMSLVDIAIDCGFASQSHMSKVFRHLLGVTPSEYRRNL